MLRRILHRIGYERKESAVESAMFSWDCPYYALDWCKYYYLFVVNKRETCQIF